MSRRTFRSALAIGFAMAALASPLAAAAADPCWLPPVDAPISDPFRDPGCPWCPGNRGIEFDTSVGTPIRAVATGRVAFAGRVVDAFYLVVRDAGGRRVTYGNLTDVAHRVGDLVVAGTVVGRAAGRFHLGVRVGDDYVDPALFLGRFVGRPRLVPTSGAPAATAPAPRLACDGHQVVSTR